MKKALLFLVFFVGLTLMAFVAYTSIYNRLVASDEAVKSAWGQVENVYQRRLDLIPNLVETVKGYAMHEKETLAAVVQARASIGKINLTHTNMVNHPDMMKKFQQSQEALSSALSRLLVVVERYPELKANQNFLALQSQLEGTENRISVERKRFNDVAQSFNTLRRSFPAILVANQMNLQEKPYFQADQGAAKVPAVKF